MNNLDLLKKDVDLVAMMKTDLGEGKRSGQWQTFSCPFPNHKHGDQHPSLAARNGSNGKPAFWKCFTCGEHGTAVDWLMKYRRIDDWSEIIRALGGDPTHPRQARIEQEYIPEARQAPADDWQTKAWEIVETCEAMLWSSIGARALAWLTGPQRKLCEASLRTWNIGYCPGLKIGGTFVERGIIIPCIEDGLIWYVNIRRPSGQPKYRKLAGSINGLFGADTCISVRDAFLVEGEFDAMQLWSVIANGFQGIDTAGVVTLGSATGKLDPATWGMHLLTARRIFACYDMDKAGTIGLAKSLGISGRMRPAYIPDGMGKDITDFVCNGGDLLAWVKYHLESS